MPKIMSVERSYYINKNIEIFTKNRLGQFSKFLDKTPIFVTYYHINKALSRYDIGTGSISAELGSQSPIRFNKIKNFPIYNIPELKPDLVYDETGIDIDIDCSDLVILPNTIKPIPGDYFIVKIPNTKEFLFRVNSIRYNTIQSNDFYLIDADLKDIGNDLEIGRMPGQIVEEYLTVFENIGTQNTCFLKTTDIEYINNLADLYQTLRDYYKDTFYIRDLNTFTYRTGRWSECGKEIYRNDQYLEKFINRSNIFYEENTETTLVLTPADIRQNHFESNFKNTLYHTVLTRRTDFLRPYCYYITSYIEGRFSIYNVMGKCGESIYLFPFKEPIEDVENRPMPIVEKLDPPQCVPTWNLSRAPLYFDSEFIKMILKKSISTDNYFEVIIFNFIYNQKMKIDRNIVISMLDNDEFTFKFLPMIIYIIGSMYQDYFVTENEIDN